jgi:hypothetical protein
MFKFCWHNWVVVSKEILPSMIEQLTAAGAESFRGNNSMGYKPCIVQYRCSKCPAEKVERV